MSEAFISSELVPPGVSDKRNRDFIAALSGRLAEFRPAALVVQDAYEAPAELLPIMVIEAGLTEFVSPDMREDLLRDMIAAAPEIHAMTGTVAGARRALKAIGVSARWTQWFEENPPAHHDTHKVVLYLADTVINGRAPLDPVNQRAAARVINATKRWSQHIAVRYGVRGDATLRPGAATRRGRTVRIRAPRLGDETYHIASYAGAGAYALRMIRIDAKAA